MVLKPMKANPMTLLAASVLWIGTLFGAYQFGHRQAVGAAPLESAGKQGERLWCWQVQ